MKMRLVVVCATPWERTILQAALPGVLILDGVAKNNLAALVPPDATHLAGAGLCFALSPHLKVGDVAVAGLVLDPAGEIFTPDPAWARTILNALSAGAAHGAESIPARTRRACLCTLYSGVEAVETAQQRAALHSQSGAWIADDHSRSLAAFAARRALPLAILRACCDEADAPLPLAVRTALVTAAGEREARRKLKSLAKQPALPPFDPDKIAANFARASSNLRAAAPALLQTHI